jgi:hypothetical protein
MKRYLPVISMLQFFRKGKLCTEYFSGISLPSQQKVSSLGAKILTQLSFLQARKEDFTPKFFSLSPVDTSSTFITVHSTFKSSIAWQPILRRFNPSQRFRVNLFRAGNDEEPENNAAESLFTKWTYFSVNACSERRPLVSLLLNNLNHEYPNGFSVRDLLANHNRKHNEAN